MRLLFFCWGEGGAFWLGFFFTMVFNLDNHHFSFFSFPALQINNVRLIILYSLVIVHGRLPGIVKHYLIPMFIFP